MKDKGVIIGLLVMMVISLGCTSEQTPNPMPSTTTTISTTSTTSTTTSTNTSTTTSTSTSTTTPPTQPPTTIPPPISTTEPTQNLEGTGVTQGDPDTYEVPEDVQAFFDECTAKGGVIGGTGGVKAGLPTTEEGYTCWYENRDCWDFLTYSRERYMGGNPGCPTAGLVGEEVKIPPITGSWNGNGEISFSGSKYCTDYNFEWSATLSSTSKTSATGNVFDEEGANIGTLNALWDSSSQVWTVTIESDIFTLINVDSDGSTISGGLTIKDAWIPCLDVTGQTGWFSGEKQ